MSARESYRPDKQATISLKGALVTAVIVVFGILHIVGAVLLRDAASPRRTDTSEILMNRD